MIDWQWPFDRVAVAQTSLWKDRLAHFLKVVEAENRGAVSSGSGELTTPNFGKDCITSRKFSWRLNLYKRKRRMKANEIRLSTLLFVTSLSMLQKAAKREIRAGRNQCPFYFLTVHRAKPPSASLSKNSIWAKEKFHFWSMWAENDGIKVVASHMIMAGVSRAPEDLTSFLARISSLLPRPKARDVLRTPPSLPTMSMSCG